MGISARDGLERLLGRQRGGGSEECEGRHLMRGASTPKLRGSDRIRWDGDGIGWDGDGMGMGWGWDGDELVRTRQKRRAQPPPTPHMAPQRRRLVGPPNPILINSVCKIHLQGT